MEIRNFQEFIIALCNYWVDHGCIWSQPHDANMGAGTFHPHTFLKGVGPEPWRSVYVQPCRRPVDGRYGKSPYRFQHYYQLQVLLKPSPSNIVDIFLKSLEHVGINLKNNDIGLLEDDWKGPTLGAWGLGWEVRANGQEVSQFTYFQQLGGIDIDVVCGEITYGLERLFMYAKGYKNALDMPFNDYFTYGDIFYQNEYEFSHYNFKEANINELLDCFNKYEQRVFELCEKGLVLPAYDFVLQASHAFNMLDARGAISVSERQRYIARVRDCAKKCAVQYRAEREKLGYPMLNILDTDARKPLLSSRNNLVKISSESNEERIYSNNDFSNKKSLNILFELGVEEMPPSFQVSARDELKQKIVDFINQKQDNILKSYKSYSEIPYDISEYIKALKDAKYSVQISSRRLSVEFTNIPRVEPKQKIEIWGPAEKVAKSSDGNLTQAGLGFCKKNNIDSSCVKFKEKANGTFLYAVKEIVGEDFPTLLAQNFKEWCYALSAPLKMKWLPAELSPTFIRPVRWILALVEDKVIPLEMFGIASGRKTYGQRILHPEAILIANIYEYNKSLENAYVLNSIEAREEKILKEVHALVDKVDGKLFKDESLLSKCIGLFENPQVFIAEFDKKYLRLPSRLIESVLREHMNYFSVTTKDEKNLLPFYIGVANYKCADVEAMIEGTKTVVVGRLEDGAFYYDTDLATPIDEFRNKLHDQLFQSGMGSLFDKSERAKKIARQLYTNLSPKFSDQLKNVDLQLIERAAELCKADLKSGCVQEFPDEMQGVMGGVLVREQNIFSDVNKSLLVAKAIEEHYMPVGAQASLPSTVFGAILSLADKLDSLCIMINHGAEVKGNKDPYGMRRYALGIARLLGLKDEINSLPISVKEAVALTLNILKETHKIAPESEVKIHAFILDRIKATLKEDFDIRSLEALSLKLISEPLVKVKSFAHAIAKALEQTGKGSLLEALIPYRRARNLTLNWNDQNISTSLFKEKEEAILFEKLITLELKVKELHAGARYEELLIMLASLAEPMASFFDNVMVNDPDGELKKNRLCLLMRIRSLYEDAADFSLIQVQ
ncbi:glycine--tRNA ligase subunit beta [Fluviispira multicolorata]|uniref:Multifunctional fusion protein n=1 Tax=Fluviispira multicolorata TaxID=2654512 RepID=A0A833N1G2_9BACT|nr:glycine--tRNA ligase subunit beta [Fluviispira multicolorata]KAB8030800.1 glycine--tRNA ligase subunit beta [Fluviispira multicolorata]